MTDSKIERFKHYRPLEEVEIHVVGPNDPTFSVDDLSQSWGGGESAATPELAVAVEYQSPVRPVVRQTDWKEGKTVRSTIIAML